MSVRHTPQPQLGDLAVDEVARAACRRLGTTTAAMHEVLVLHVQALVAAAEWNSPDMLTEHLGWERVRLASLGVVVRYRDLPEAVLTVLHGHVDRVLHARLRVLYTQAERLDEGRPPSPSPATPVDPDVERYLLLALAGDRAGATNLVRATLARGVAPTQVIQGLLGPAQVEIGRRWENGEVTISQEHRVTAITTRCVDLVGALGRLPVDDAVVSDLDGDLDGDLEAPRAARRVVIATCGPENHDLGVKMLAQVLDHGGVDVDYLGAGIPVDDLVAHVLDTRPGVLALSATMTSHVSAVAQVLLALRDAGSDARVLVGGRVFTARPALARALGADDTASDAESALALCRGWLDELHVAPQVDEPDDAAGPAADPDPDPSLAELALRYRIDPKHVDGALAMLAGESGLSREDLVRRLSPEGSTA